VSSSKGAFEDIEMFIKINISSGKVHSDRDLSVAAKGDSADYAISLIIGTFH